MLKEKKDDDISRLPLQSTSSKPTANMCHQETQSLTIYDVLNTHIETHVASDFNSIVILVILNHLHLTLVLEGRELAPLPSTLLGASLFVNLESSSYKKIL